MINKLMKIIDKWNYDDIGILFLRPMSKESIYISIIAVNNEETHIIRIRCENNKIIVANHKNFLDIGEELGELEWFDLLYFISLCAQLPNCVI